MLALLAGLVLVEGTHAYFHVDVGAAPAGGVAAKMIAAIDELVSAVDFPILALAMNAQFDVSLVVQWLIAHPAILDGIGFGLATVNANPILVPAPAGTLAGNLGSALGTFQGAPLEHPGTVRALTDAFHDAESAQHAAVTSLSRIAKRGNVGYRLIGSLAHRTGSVFRGELSHSNTV